VTTANRPEIDIQKIVTEAQLPALPHSAISLLELSQDPENGPVEFSVPIESDPGLTGQVLRFVNSSYFGFSREISSVKLAITLVGIRTIKNFALWSAVFSLMPNPKCGPFDLRKLWQDSLRRALCARRLSRLLNVKEPEEPFAAALLQDMAVPLLAKSSPEIYTKLLEARNNGNVRLSFLEKRLFGWTHGEAGGIMARHWKLPEGFAELVEGHQSVDPWIEDPEANAGKLMVAMSALLPTTVDSKWHESEKFERHYTQLCPVGGPDLAKFLGQLDDEFIEFAPVLKLATPAKSLVDVYNETTSSATA
jgi:HD-like signal output (HDOD) protein